MTTAAESTSIPFGPKGLPVFGSILDFHRAPLSFLRTVAEQHSPACRVRFGPRLMIVVSAPELIERLLVGAAQECVKDRPTQALVRLVGRGLLTSEGEDWKRQRRLAAPAFQPRRIASYADTMVSCARQAFSEYRDGEVRNFHTDIMALTLDIVSKTLFGVSAKHQAECIADAMERALPYFEERLFTLRALLPAWIPSRRSLALASAVRALDEVVASIIAESRKHGEQDSSLIGRLIQARDEDGTGLSDSELRDQAMTLLLAGHETTALTVMFAVFLLATHPAQARALYEELDREVGQRAVTAEDLTRLSYLDAVVKETLRLYPAAPILGREVAAPFELGGYAIKPAEEIVVSPYAVQRNARYFEAPDAFRPERWLDGLAKRLPRFAYFPFGGGPRVCIGNHFATMEAALLLASLAQQVILKVPADFRMELRPIVTLRSRHGLPVHVQRRDRTQSVVA